jgi:hypothetical protein
MLFYFEKGSKRGSISEILNIWNVNRILFSSYLLLLLLNGLYWVLSVVCIHISSNNALFVLKFYLMGKQLNIGSYEYNMFSSNLIFIEHWTQTAHALSGERHILKWASSLMERHHLVNVWLSHYTCIYQIFLKCFFLYWLVSCFQKNARLTE